MTELVDPGTCKAGVLPAPQFVTLVTCGTFKEPNTAAVTYCGQLTDAIAYVALRPSRYSNEVIQDSKEFTINYMPASSVGKVDYCGIVSGKDVDKFKTTGLTKENGVGVNCPSVGESMLSLECKVIQVLRVGHHDIFVGQVVQAIGRQKDCGWLYQHTLKYYDSLGKYLGDVFSEGKKLQ